MCTHFYYTYCNYGATFTELASVVLQAKSLKGCQRMVNKMRITITIMCEGY